MNTEIAKHLRTIAQLKALDGDNKFSIKAYEEAAKAAEISDAISEENVNQISGVGEKIASVIREFLATKNSTTLTDLQSRWPAEILSLTIIDGIGPKRALKLYLKGYHSFEQLHAAAVAGELDAKLATATILANYKKSGRLPFHAANQIGTYFKEALGKVAGVSNIEVGGSLRRKTETAKDVDLLACVETEEIRPTLMEAFKVYGPSSFQGQEAKASIQFPFSSSQMIHIDLWIAAKSYWGTLLNHVTGSKEHNIALRTLAKNKGFVRI